MYRFIEAEREEERSVNRACAVLEVSRAAWYEWSQQEPSRREREDLELTEKVKTVFKSSRQTYGSPRVHSELRQRGLRCSRKRVERLMRQEGLQGRPPKRRRRTTIPDPEPPPESIDLIGRRFDPSELALNACWAGDITYVRTWEGWMYLATVIDLASRRVVGWAMADHMRAELVCEALQMAIARRRPGPGLIFHSDRGSQYTSKLFRGLLERHGIRQSLARPRQCWDNAVAEAFWSTLKIELVQRQAWPTRAVARQAVFEWIESFYNLQRLHSSLGYWTRRLRGRPHWWRFPNGSGGMSQNAIAVRATGATVCNGSGNGPEARRCLICERPAQGRSAYCSDAHRVAAFRLRHRQELAPRAAGLRAELRRRGQLAANTVYECEDCGERFLSRQRCDGCKRFCRAVGLGGHCPGCDEPLLIADLLGEAWR